MGGLRQYVGNMVSAFGKLSQGKRLAVLAGAAAVLSLVVLAGVYWSRPAYSPLFTGLTEKDAAAIVAKLQDQRIPYKLSPDGTSIFVPAAQVAQTRLDLAEAGLPTGGVVGLELFDTNKLGTTDFQQRINLVQALQGELTRTIMQIDQVEAARVHIVLPQDSVFVGQARPATAAVLVKLKPGETLDAQQVRGIVNLVAHSVEGLDTQNVVVIDDTGRVLSAGLAQDNSAVQAAGDQLALQQDVEAHLQQNLQSLLDQVLGPGNSVVRVQADLDFNKQITESSIFQPAANNQGIVRSIQQLQETFKGTGTVAGGVPGSSSNGAGIPTYPAGGTNGTSDYSRTETTTNYEISQTNQRLEVAPGAVKRLSVAVVVNRQLTADEQKSLQGLVSAAIGYDATRNDVISVTGIPFDTSLLQALKNELDQEAKAQSRTRLFTYIGSGVLLAALAGGIIFLLNRRKSMGQPAAAPAGAPAGEQPGLSPAGVPGAEETGLLPGLTLGQPDQDRDRMRQGLEQLARQKPEVVAQLIRMWMNEE